eukprot:TRINITY_DN367_c4_g1_i2.p1 TRINITY_DN367_c4_g1~~TRINITY_DN367_c4_g1_i2.p1  ORF type:complete len:369 (+),score=103.02 TRINITY_DN367_c4_g1_i2:147-1253(+)
MTPGILTINRYTRFRDEYSAPNNTAPGFKKKPDDYRKLFEANTDDSFRIGVTISRTQITLFSKFYSSDIIIASPVGLILTMQEQKEFDCDFLSSIEMVILERADIMMHMQNPNHLEQILSYLNRYPKSTNDTNFTRVRGYTLSGKSCEYCQTIIYSPFLSGEINKIFHQYSYNKAGQVKIIEARFLPAISACINKISIHLEKIDCKQLELISDARFDYFEKKIFPKLRDTIQPNTLIFIPSYFDFVRIRNLFLKEEVDCEFLHEYTTRKDVKKSKKKFATGKSPYIIYTERVHFFFRINFSTIKQIIFYGPPLYNQFFSEFVNMLQHTDSQCTLLYSIFDKFEIERIVGKDNSKAIMNSNSSNHMITL